MSTQDQTGMAEQENDKENAGEETPSRKAAATSMNPPPQPSSQRSAGKDLRDCPQTPIGRLPLSELLANGDDPRNQLELTPIERVLWENSPLSSSTPSSMRPSKKRKRAQSSSPASSSQNQSSKHFAEGEPPADVQALREALKTPKADLVDDLWSRYSLHIDKRSPSTPHTLQFPPLMHSSSPAPDLPSKDSTGLRRSFSCIDWPTSAAKRRKWRVSSSQIEAVTAPPNFDKPLDTIEKTKMSRVSFLVEKIHGHLAKPAQRQDITSSDPSGSSPVVSNPNSPAREAPVSPQSQAWVEDVVTVLSQAAMEERRSQPAVLSAEDLAELDRAEASSDYDDDDLDMGMIEALNVDIAGDESKAAEESHLGQSSSQTLRASNGNNRTPTPTELERKNASPQVNDSIDFTAVHGIKLREANPNTLISPRDEFDDDDEDVTAAELEGVFAKYDTQRSPPTATDKARGRGQEVMIKKDGTLQKKRSISEKKAPVPIEVLSDEDDDFGGDSDFDQIAAECTEASQPQQGRSQTQASVCSSRYGSSI